MRDLVLRKETPQQLQTSGKTQLFTRIPKLEKGSVISQLRVAYKSLAQIMVGQTISVVTFVKKKQLFRLSQWP